MTHQPHSAFSGDQGAQAGTVARPRFAELAGYSGLLVALIVLIDAYQFLSGTTYDLRQGAEWPHLFGQSSVFVACLSTVLGFGVFFPSAQRMIGGATYGWTRGSVFKRALYFLPVYYAAILLVWSLNYTGRPGNWLDLLQHLGLSPVNSPPAVSSVWAAAVPVALCVLLGAAGPVLSWLQSNASRTLRMWALLGTPTALVVVSMLFKVWEGMRPAGSTANVSPLGLLDTFALGMLLGALLASFPDVRLTRPIQLVLRLAALGGLALLTAERLRVPWDGPFDLSLAGLCMALLIASTVFAAHTSRFTQAFSQRFLIDFGLISQRFLTYLGLAAYGVFLWREPLMAGLAGQVGPVAVVHSAVLLLSVAVLLATALYWLIERPASPLQRLVFPQQARQDAYYRYLQDARGAISGQRGSQLRRAFVYSLCALAVVVGIVGVSRFQRRTAIMPPTVGEGPAQPSPSAGRQHATAVTPEQPPVVPHAAAPLVTHRPTALPQTPQVAVIPTTPPPSSVKAVPSATERALTRGRELSAEFYAGRLDQVWDAFLPAVRADWKDFAAFKAYKADGLKAFGAEQHVIREKVTRKGAISYYSRTATFERGPKTGWTLVFGLDATGRVQEFGIVSAEL